MIIFMKYIVDAADLDHVYSYSQNLHCYKLFMTIEHNATTITYNHDNKSGLAIRTNAKKIPWLDEFLLYRRIRLFLRALFLYKTSQNAHTRVFMFVKVKTICLGYPYVPIIVI